MYKTEWILGLIGSIFAALGVLGIIIITAFFSVFFGSGLMPFMMDGGAFINIGFISSFFIIIMIVVGLFATAVTVLGFIGTAKLKRDDKRGGVLLIIAGGISFFSAGLITAVLLLVGGIMAASKKQITE